MTVKVNVGDYQSVDFFAAMKSEVQGEAEARMESARLHKTLNEVMVGRLRAHMKARGKKYTDAQICRMYGLTLATKPADDFG